MTARLQLEPGWTPWATRRGPRSPEVSLAARRLQSVAAEATRLLLERSDGSVLDAAERLHVLARAVTDSHGVDLVTRGTLPAGPAVIAVNHLSYLDPLLVASLAPVAPIAKGELSSWPVLGPSMQRLGVMFTRRGDPVSGALTLRRALRVLRYGVPVLNFPEGTTSHGEVLLPFKRGIFGLARLAAVPVVPAALALESADLCWVGDALFVPHYLRVAARTRVRAALVVGEPLRAVTFAHADDLRDAAREQMSALLRDARRLVRRSTRSLAPS